MVVAVAVHGCDRELRGGRYMHLGPHEGVADDVLLPHGLPCGPPEEVLTRLPWM